MKWLLLALAVALGAAITWFLTVKRASRTAGAEDQAVVGPSGEARGDADLEDDATGFGGAHTPVSESPGPAEAWDRDAQDEDALLSRPSPAARVDRTSRAPDAEAGAAEEIDELEVDGSGGPVDTVAPVADATPNGDVAGVGEPDAVAAVDAILPLDGDVSRPTRSETSEAQQARPAQGELIGDDENEESVPPEDRPDPTL